VGATVSAPWGDRPLEQADILTKEQVADLLGLRPSTIDDLRRRGDLPAIHLGRHRRFLRSDIEQYVITSREGAGR
jgi:excisionase family DNA binding protein